MNQSLTDDDIREYLGDINIIKYSEIRDYPTIESLLDGGPSVILYKTSPTYGHWTCIFQGPDGINYFDSYGKMIDQPLKFGGASKQAGQDYEYLTKLLSESAQPVHYNDHKFQRVHSDVTTCGRHVILRLLNMDLTAEEYIKYVQRLCQYTKLRDPDYLVVSEIGFGF